MASCHGEEFAAEVAAVEEKPEVSELERLRLRVAELEALGDVMGTSFVTV